MSDALNNFNYWGWKRKEELLPEIFVRTQGKVHQGPFKGMSIILKFSWGDGDTMGKLLGIYENELHHVIEEQLQQTTKCDLFLNIGCAEGYYGLGLAMRQPQTLSVLFDISENAIAISRENAIANNLNNVEFSIDCSVQNIRNYLVKSNNPFIVMDVEGHENILLNKNTIPELIKSTIMVESHDCIIPNMTAMIVDRFKNTHQVIIIDQGTKNPYLDILHDLSDSDKMLLCSESRPSTMSWVFLRPWKTVIKGQNV